MKKAKGPTNKIPARFGTERIAALTDGTIAIVATLIVLVIEPPKGHENLDEVIHALIGMKTLFFAYLVTFIQVSLYWKRHHALLDHIEYLDSGLMALALGFLMVVAFVPFPTALLCEYHNTSAASGVMALYSCMHVASSALLAAMWHRAVRKNLLKKDTNHHQITRLGQHLMWGTVGYAIAVPLAFVDKHLSLLAILLTTLIELFPRSNNDIGNR
jgi:uncharacterized membrane protein